MLSGFYTGASGVLTQQRALNVLANNVSNAKTPGYRSSRVVTTTFEHELMVRQDGLARGRDGQALGTFARTGIGVTSPIRVVEEVAEEWQQGFMEETSRPYDLAIGGEGFFTVQTQIPPAQGETQGQPGELYLTRSGNFDIDAEGFLILPGVGRVQGEKGDLKIGGSKFKVEVDGTVYNDKGRRIDKLRVVNPAFTDLKYAENGRYSFAPKASEDPTQPLPELTNIEGFNIEQNMLELSNVNVNREIMSAMEIQRAFQACIKAMGILDSMSQKAASQIASL